MAAQGSNVLAELGGGWLQCQDEQGIFYFNQVTQQSSDFLPAELGGAPQQPVSYIPTQQMPQVQPQVQYLQPQVAPAQPQVQYLQQTQAQPQVQYLQQAQAQSQVQYLSQAQANPQMQYLSQAQAQPQVQYTNGNSAAGAYQTYLQQSTTPAAGAVQFTQMASKAQYTPTAQVQPQVQYMQQAQAQPQAQYVQQAQFPTLQQTPQVIQQQAAPQEAQSIVKLEIGEWLVCEDAQGEFYFHAPSGQSFDQAPPELVEIIRVSQGPQVQMAQPNIAAQQSYGQQLAGNVQYVQYG